MRFSRVPASTALVVMISWHAFAAPANPPSAPPDSDVLIETLRPTPVSEWTLSLGVTGFVAPTYDGSREYFGALMPLVEITYSDWFDASLFEGVQIKAFRSGAWTIGPLLKFDYTARPARDEAASGISGIDRTIGIGGFVDYQFSSNVKLRTEVLESVHIQQGLSAKFALLYEAKPLKALTITLGPNIRWANRLWIDSGFSDGFEFGPNPAQGSRRRPRMAL